MLNLMLKYYRTGARKAKKVIFEIPPFFLSGIIKDGSLSEWTLRNQRQVGQKGSDRLLPI